MWKVRIYYNTGFDAVNCPDSEATLEASATAVNAQQLPRIPNQAKTHPAFADFPTIDCLQRFHLNNVRIQGFEDDIIQADYLKLYDDNDLRRFAFYSIQGYNMVNGDTIELDITMDPLLTAGGVEQIDFIDGMTSRHHVSETQDQFGTYAEDDDLLIPTHTIRKKLVASYYNDVKFSVLASSQYHLDNPIELKTPNTLIVASGADTGTITYEGSTSGVTYIQEAGAFLKTAIRFFKGDNSAAGEIQATTRVFDLSSSASYTNFMNNVKKLIECGRTDVVEDAYMVPKIFLNDGVTFTRASGGTQFESIDIPLIVRPYVDLINTGSYDFEEGKDFPTGGVMDTKANYAESNAKLRWRENDFRNKRVIYGKYNSYTFVCASSGDNVTLNPEEIKTTSDLYVNKAYEFPPVYASPDIRPNGCVTYYIPTKQTTYNPHKPSFPTKIKSATWPKANVTTIAGNGSAINRALYESKSTLADISLEADRWAEVNKKGGINNLPIIGDFARSMREARNLRDQGIGGNQFQLGFNRLMYGVGGTLAGGVIGSGHQAAVSGTMGDPYNSGLAGALNNYSGGNKGGKDYYERAAAKQQELMEFQVNNIPQVQVISKADGADANLLGYGVWLYRTELSDNDLVKFDRILTQFGYKVTEPIKKEFMTNRPAFNYIQASGVKVQCKSLPKSVTADLSALFNNGVRIWHVKPSASHYEGNVTKEETNNV